MPLLFTVLCNYIKDNGTLTTLLCVTKVHVQISVKKPCDSIVKD